MTKIVKVNENYQHACDGMHVKMTDWLKPLSKAGYSDSEFAAIVDFYVLQPCVAKGDKSSSQNPRTLGSLGWGSGEGNQSLSKLEGLLLKNSGMSSRVMMKSRTITATLEAMNLNGEICIEHPRCVLRWDTKVELEEDGEIKKTTNGTRVGTLLRHVRNAIAHSQTYVFSNGMIMLEDKGDGGLVTARILLRKETLLDWIDIIDPNFRKHEDF